MWCGIQAHTTYCTTGCIMASEILWNTALRVPKWHCGKHEQWETDWRHRDGLYKSLWQSWTQTIDRQDEVLWCRGKNKQMDRRFPCWAKPKSCIRWWEVLQRQHTLRCTPRQRVRILFISILHQWHAWRTPPRNNSPTICWWYNCVPDSHNHDAKKLQVYNRCKELQTWKMRANLVNEIPSWQVPGTHNKEEGTYTLWLCASCAQARTRTDCKILGCHYLTRHALEHTSGQRSEERKPGFGISENYSL